MILPGVSKFEDNVDVAETDYDVRNQNDETKYHRPDIMVAMSTTNIGKKKMPVDASDDGAGAGI